ncbi:hypothetical protein COU62_01505 [Candidatus Pacearchaeota archaeon CG10_big_fil_rev_8_21_14_0_10_35_219]|nr:methyltransferase [Candidatus Pacearchaeota archaeon]OIO43400.1 MAG: hypothetical protein AUJ63_00730 [Candidatus Pacearchaeota archaeon CG1_02_35_32]PIO08044.1 MAG: hypothetical protein COU62_01505 [Candidatus Pacearchaeota archaeon CG10_big_fil_rev_8_21_14_0_10_35_219]PIY81556.1 MAG: hypothetical protein COY79_02345 [Candidatus Pacearchaeota archaeon CG_4_10_14_0_8_um_filter_35_169]PIZ78931.1 MAG: hypothetical protein COY00_04730 [Candidatus Pacearchaeota archaeon CG_4_10_14_0_2_um_filter_
MIYQPSDDSHLLEKQISKYANGKSCLDMGSGSGILAESCMKARASSVTVVDISPKVIEYIKAKFNDDKIKIVKSNLFSKIKGRFDLIIFNPPYLPLDSREDKKSRLATTGGKKGDELIQRFLKQAQIHMHSDSVILLLLSSLTPRKRIINLLSQQNLSYKSIAKKKLFQETLEVWEIQHNNQ